MGFAAAHRAVLTAHPSTVGDVVRGLAVHVLIEEPGILRLVYALDADLSRVRVPSSRAGSRTDGLWRHTCFEAFVAPAGAPGYCELNFTPSLDWDIYRFAAYREGMLSAHITRAPQICVRRADGGLELDSAVRLHELLALGSARRLRLALAGVVEEDNGRLSYWALRHAPGKPDFHHPEGFALELALP